jgi:hypothetical protein
MLQAYRQPGQGPHPEAGEEPVVDHIPGGALESSRQCCVTLQRCAPLNVFLLPLAVLTELLHLRKNLDHPLLKLMFFTRLYKNPATLTCTSLGSAQSPSSYRPGAILLKQ